MGGDGKRGAGDQQHLSSLSIFARTESQDVARVGTSDDNLEGWTEIAAFTVHCTTRVERAEPPHVFAPFDQAGLELLDAAPAHVLVTSELNRLEVPLHVPWDVHVSCQLKRGDMLLEPEWVHAHRSLHDERATLEVLVPIAGSYTLTTFVQSRAHTEGRHRIAMMNAIECNSKAPVDTPADLAPLFGFFGLELDSHVHRYVSTDERNHVAITLFVRRELRDRLPEPATRPTSAAYRDSVRVVTDERMSTHAASVHHSEFNLDDTSRAVYNDALGFRGLRFRPQLKMTEHSLGTAWVQTFTFNDQDRIMFDITLPKAGTYTFSVSVAPTDDSVERLLRKASAAAGLPAFDNVLLDASGFFRAVTYRVIGSSMARGAQPLRIAAEFCDDFAAVSHTTHTARVGLDGGLRIVFRLSDYWLSEWRATDVDEYDKLRFRAVLKQNIRGTQTRLDAARLVSFATADDDPHNLIVTVRTPPGNPPVTFYALGLFVKQRNSISYTPLTSFELCH